MIDSGRRRFSDLRVLVAGASRGIGKASALGLSRAGAKVFGVARGQKDLNGLLADFKGDDNKVHACDLSDRKSVEDLIQEISDWGIPDIIVANFYHRRPLRKLIDSSWPEDNGDGFGYLYSLFSLCLPEQRRKAFGRWIAVSSLVSEFAGPGQASYSIEKKSLEAIFRTLALEESKYGITANTVVPGFVDTPGTRTNYSEQRFQDLESLNLLGRAAQPEEISAMIEFLASPEASYVTGAKLFVTGGAHLNWPLRNKTGEN